jgi:hypothetical protein
MSAGGCPRVRSLHFDRHERPARTVVVTHHGLVRVEWLEVAGDRCWFSSGTGDAKQEAVRAIERIERMCESMR